MSGKVCEARAVVWREMSDDAKDAALPSFDAEYTALLVPCPLPSLTSPPGGCGARAGEPCREPCEVCATLGFAWSEGCGYCAGRSKEGLAARVAGLPCTDPDACDPCRRGEHAPADADCGCLCSCPCDDDLLRTRATRDATPATDVGELRARAERAEAGEKTWLERSEQVTAALDEARKIAAEADARAERATAEAARLRGIIDKARGYTLGIGRSWEGIRRSLDRAKTGAPS